MPPDTVYSAVSRITKGRYSASSACTRLTRAAPAPNTAAKGSRKASAQAAVNFPKCRCQKWGATSGTRAIDSRSEEHTSELHHSQISYAVFCLKKKKKRYTNRNKFSSTTLTLPSQTARTLLS